MAQGNSAEHIPVLLDEVLKYLVQSKAGTYVDATFGRGGHSRALLKALPAQSVLVAMDRDPSAVAEGLRLALQDSRFHMVHARFSRLAEVLKQQGEGDVQGVLMDLGVSSPQLDDAQRGFSFRFSAPLDMRMDPQEGVSAAAWLNVAEESAIARVLKDFADERFARRIAHAIVASRPIHTTDQLAELVVAVVPSRAAQGKHPATKTFQAIRIFINEETQELEAGLQAAFAALAEGGRLAVISFHSNEDRVVKHTFRSLTRPPVMPRRIPLRHDQLHTQAVDIAGPIRPGAKEIAANPRARSATLRVIEKVASGG